jgi:hypothetical protein
VSVCRGCERVTIGLSHQRFLSQLGSKFRLRFDDGPVVELEISEVSELVALPGQETYSVVLRGDTSFLLTQRTYRLEHPEFGEVELFLVPIRQDKDGVYYEAVFNRLVAEDKSSKR